MNLYDSPRWTKDIDTVLRELPELSELAGRSVMITGAAGLICSAVADILFRYNETHATPVTILAAGRQPEKMESRFGAYCRKAYFQFVPYDAVEGKNNLRDSCDYIIHGASHADPGRIVKEPVETMCSNFTGLLELLRYAGLCGAKRVLYISSSEVYGRKESHAPCREEEQGYVDLMNPRSSYSQGKRAAETLCAAYASEYGVESVIVRPGHIYGPTASPCDTRVSSAWAYMAAQGQDIVMKSDGAQLRSYCYCLDCASAILKVLLSGKSMYAYNISNPRSILTIKEAGQLLAGAGGVRLVQETASEKEKRGFNPMENSSLDSRRLEALGWKGCFTAKEGFYHTVEILKFLQK